MKLGTINKLKVTELIEDGYLLADEDSKDIFLAKNENDNPLKINESIDAFVYSDKNQRLIATTQTPTVEFEHFAYLKVRDINTIGAFMDWGISKDLLVPYAEQTTKMIVGERYLVFLFLDDKSNRLVGSCKKDDFLLFDKERIKVTIGDQVDLLLFKETELGINAIVNNMYKGLIFKSDIHKKIQSGDRIKGYVKNIRDDGQLDLVLEPLGYKKSIDPTILTILSKLKANNGLLYLTDKSQPEKIKQELGLSKKAFKRGIGNLYKQKRILILKDHIQLI